MYAWGASAALLLSFLLVAWFATAGSGKSVPPIVAQTHRGGLPKNVRRVLKALSVLGLLLTLATGFFGNRNPYLNFSMTFFWIAFVLGFAYLTAVVGDLYDAINPWRTLAQMLERGVNGFTHGRLRYPPALGYWPALAFYMAFIWIELFGHTKPFSLATILAVYSGVNLFGVWLVGEGAWFRYCEFFAVFFRLIAKMAPVDYAPGRGLRAPFTGLLEESAENYSLLVFALFMLSSTAFDGLSATVPWMQLFWRDQLHLITPWLGDAPIRQYALMRSIYVSWETLCLLLSPFFYLAIYLAFVGLVKLITRSPIPLRELALRFGFSLLPIALVYNITHYYTLLLTQGVAIMSLLSDPFGRGWNLFGTAGLLRSPILPDMALVWHTQVGLILVGHVVSVYLAHVEALRIFPTRRQAALSQLPMLLLMMLFTTAGLWILAQPIQAGL